MLCSLTLAVCNGFMISACSGGVEPVVKNSPDVPVEVLLIQKREAEAASKTYDVFGELISTVNFTMQPSKEDDETGDTDLIPWIGLEGIDAELDRLIEPDEVVVSNKKVTILIDYPLNNPVRFDLISKKEGFSRKHLAVEISRKYHSLYIEEEETASVKTIPPEQRKTMINRNETNGKYGIWGHDLGDLALRAIEVRRSSDGEILLCLLIES